MFDKGVELMAIHSSNSDNLSICNCISAISQDEEYKALSGEFENMTNELKCTMNEEQLQLFFKYQSKANDIRNRIKQISLSIMEKKIKEEIINHSQII
jgi:arginyl-tRNA--protein-N-Asp/Glu arginylyltransferase